MPRKKKQVAETPPPQVVSLKTIPQIHIEVLGFPPEDYSDSDENYMGIPVHAQNSSYGKEVCQGLTHATREEATSVVLLVTTDPKCSSVEEYDEEAESIFKAIHEFFEHCDSSIQSIFIIADNEILRGYLNALNKKH